MNKIHSLLTVIGKDRPGIIAAVTEALYREGCNLEDMTMTVLEDELAMMIMVGAEGRKKVKVQRRLGRLEKSRGLTFFWKDLGQYRPRPRTRKTGRPTYLISAMGRDRTGIVYKISRALAACRLNITDLNSRVVGTGKKAVYAMILEVDVPSGFRIAVLERPFKALRKELGIDLTLKPVEQLEF